jgi:hypothetical protein
MLYLALRHAQHAVDCITEEDILDGYLKNLKVVYFAGEWIDNRVIPKLEEWVKAGGVLYCCAGCGHLNQYGEPEPAMLKLLGLKDIKTTKNAYHMRTLLELPLVEPIDEIGGGEHHKPIKAIAMKQQLVPDKAEAFEKSSWKNGGAAMTLHGLGKGYVVAVGTVVGTSYVKSGLKAAPWARGGRHTLYYPTDPGEERVFLESGFFLAQIPLLVMNRDIPPHATSSNLLVESIVLDHKDGTLLTLVNWTNAPVKNLEMRVRMKDAPKTVRTVSGQRNLAFTAKDGVVTFRLDLAEADYVVLRK